jgi:hypothetical protein
MGRMREIPVSHQGVPNGPRQVFVFGSNLAGRHGRGAAKEAAQHWGAKYGVGEGPTGRAYAIPTKDEHLNTLPLPTIAHYVKRFLGHASAHEHLTFHVTGIGTGLAGYSATDIAPMFRGHPPNVILPTAFRQALHV